MTHTGPDQHLRKANDDAQDALIAERQVAAQNVAEWKRRAKHAIDDGELYQAIHLIQQAMHLIARWNLDGSDPNK